ncbi:MAG: SufD family Fe-S cluster assembly protein [Anaerolineae bacterium]|jgi:Fe-S cluster assembly scaffold protein SufB|nr:SufD family Fe-S cluster assembly protein [Anaerolineae bacterium]MDH7475236.1 SufD family Fe-S cluster assembly protein [Anaerolineae bacterium]
MSDFEAILKAYERSGGDPNFLRSPKVASLVISGNRVLGANQVPGVRIEPEEIEHGVRVKVIVEPGTRLDVPAHLCFGVIPAEGVQEILPEFEIGAGSRAEFIAHCTFPNAVNVRHLMEARIHVGENATMKYGETHYHGEAGGVEVVPKAQVTVDKGGHYSSEFALTTGRVGKLDFDYVVDVAAHGVAELVAKAYGYGNDAISVKETIRLNGEYARGLAKSRIAVRDEATSEVMGATEGNAPFARGHVDCIEVVRDRAVANAIPIVKVRDDRAYVTHEAAIGTVNKKELETLMSRGLDEETAVDVIIRGMLAG